MVWNRFICKCVAHFAMIFCPHLSFLRLTRNRPLLYGVHFTVLLFVNLILVANGFNCGWNYIVLWSRIRYCCAHAIACRAQNAFSNAYIFRFWTVHLCILEANNNICVWLHNPFFRDESAALFPIYLLDYAYARTNYWMHTHTHTKHMKYLPRKCIYISTNGAWNTFTSILFFIHRKNKTL